MMKKMSGSFRNTQWDPALIISQIIAVQCIVYLSLGIIMAVLDLLTGDSNSLEHLFEYHEIHIRDVGGRMVIIAFILNSLIGSLVLWFIVQRTKQCLDFSCTWHLLHLLICWSYNGSFPSSLSWWLLNIACVTLMCVCGEFLCLRTELREIPLSLGPKVDL
ncbi:protein SYS1 homolog [Chrysoperla carnea]|uniref:protein SYS1 homolog n=1 Tax=Chrysoperla carnea TaxID=189513 RepID=UPI001D08C6CF|nr:protein SYS1 homolog [Chrysoperla carnea]